MLLYLLVIEKDTTVVWDNKYNYDNYKYERGDFHSSKFNDILKIMRQKSIIVDNYYRVISEHEEIRNKFMYFGMASYNEYLNSKVFVITIEDLYYENTIIE